jgi:hypothetical protein
MSGSQCTDVMETQFERQMGNERFGRDGAETAGLRIDDYVETVCQAMHRPYASLNWIRFNGSLRCRSQQYLSPLSGHPR